MHGVGREATFFPISAVPELTRIADIKINKGLIAGPCCDPIIPTVIVMACLKLASQDEANENHLHHRRRRSYVEFGTSVGGAHHMRPQSVLPDIIVPNDRH